MPLVPEAFASWEKRTRLIQIDELAGSEVTLAGAGLRTSGLEIVGAAKGVNVETMSWEYEQVLT